MRKLLLSCLLLIFVSAYSYADVLIPEFSFTGEDISKFSVAPSYMDVSLSFDVNSGLDTYLKQEEFKLEDAQEKEYSSSEPGGMYSGGFGTRLSSVFVGEKAFRNNIVKSYIRKEYLHVIEAYGKYNQKLVGTAYEEECKLLYALSLMEIGNLTNGINILKEVIDNGGLTGDIALDSLFSYYFRIKNYEAIVEVGLKQPNFTEYSLYTYLFSLMQRKQYSEIVQTSKAQLELFDTYPYMYDFVIVAYYLLGEHLQVANLASKATSNTVPMVADTLISIGEVPEAEKLIRNLPKTEARNVLEAKIDISHDELNAALKLVNTLNSDDNKLNVFFFYTDKNFPKIWTGFGDGIVFNKKINSDYINYYNGLAEMSSKNYGQALNRLNNVIFHKQLVESAYFYRGIAYFRSDIQKTEFLLLRFIDSSDENEKVQTARYILGQIYNVKGRNDDALMLIENCSTSDCRLLKAEINIEKQQYETAEELIGNLKTEKAYQLRAAILYNKKDYDAALKEIEKSDTRGKETDYLLMLIYLKLNRYEEAMNVYEKHFTDVKFFDSLAESLFLAGEYDSVISLLNRIGVSNKNTLLRAKIYTSTQKYKEAEILYRTLLSDNYAVFDSVYGLLSGYAARNMKTEFLKTGEMTLTGFGRFEQKDFLLLQAARLAIDLNEIDLATKMVNRFFSEFPDSKYTREGYLLRGRLFKTTGRLEQCVADAERLIAIGGSEEEALFLKADCTEVKKPQEALKIYIELAETSERFRDLANSKIIEVSKTPAEVLKATEHFKDENSELYFKGMDKYLTMIAGAELLKSEDLINEMIASRNVIVSPSAYYNLARLQELQKQDEKAAATYMKGYYLFPNSKYAKLSLGKTVAIYRKLGKAKEAGILKKKLNEK